jgi:hypothetical protein
MARHGEQRRRPGIHRLRDRHVIPRVHFELGA